MEEAIAEIDRLIQLKEHSYVVTPNMDHIVVLEKDNDFKRAYDNASLILTDGTPLLWISNCFGSPIKEKVSGADIFPKICNLAAKRKYRVFILGGKEGVADKAATNLIKKNPELQVVGTYSPPVGFENNTEEVDRIIERINRSKADILTVSLGSPKGEKFIYRIHERICSSLSISIGAAVDFEAGVIKRAPTWMSNLGFEWLYRIKQEPVRLSKRYMNDAIKIIPIIWKYRNYNSNNT